MPRNSLQLRPSRFTSGSFASSPPGVTHSSHALPAGTGNSIEVQPIEEIERGLSHGNEDDDEEEDKEVVMAVDYRGRKLGCTFYREQDRTLWFVNDINVSMFGPEGGAAKEVLESLKFQIEPTIILFPARADDLFAASDSGGDADTETATTMATDLNIRPASEFSVEQGMNKLANLTFDAQDLQAASFVTPTDTEAMEIDDELRFGQHHQHDGNTTGTKQSVLRLESYIDTEGNYVSVGCAGAVLIYIRRKLKIQNPFADSGAPNDGVSRLKLWTMANSMFINADTMTSLQIFGSESHPAVKAQMADIKGGVSLFNLVNKTRTPQGSHYLKQMFLRPSLDIAVITARHNAIHTLNRPDNSNAVGGLNKSLKRVPDMIRTLTKLKKGGSTGAPAQIEVLQNKKKAKTASTRTWVLISQFVSNAIKIRNYVADLLVTQDVDIFCKIAEKFEIEHLQTVANLIGDNIDFDASRIESHVYVKSGIDARLDNLRNTYHNINHILSEAAERVHGTLPQDVQDLNITVNVAYYPQLGYLLAVPLDEDGQPIYSGEVDIREGESHWEWVFSTDVTAYFKTDEMGRLSDEVGDVVTLISDREIEILYRLQERVLEYKDVMIACSNICAELDALMSLAHTAMEHNWVRPLMTDSNVVKISNGRHPLQERCVTVFVPNDTNIQGGAGENAENINSNSMDEDDDDEAGKCMMIVTGPNFSGKSVYLKQVALIVYMAHIGSYVPAESATIGLTDAILTRIQTRESVTKTQSAFMIDLQQIAAALRLTSRRSLLIIDEFGKGTESTDGAGLACAVAEHLLELGAEAPKTLMTTHHHEIFENGFLEGHPSLSHGQMRILLDRNADDARNQITYLYTLEKGRSISSFGTICAAMNGVDHSIVTRAEDLIIKLARGDDLASAITVLSPEEERDYGCAKHAATRFMALDFRGDMTDEEMQASGARQDPKAMLEIALNGRLA
ncbi:MutS protein msh5 [Orbilia brochopaga]|uniref:DNA mismatch repair protein MSH5 n=1 Tax=Orbilia brochopaga TaxID=3140254 RepID=A0AAV9VCE4_9PEZI